MPQQIKVIQTWTRLPLTGIDSFSFNVVNQMTNNEYFPKPDVPLDVLFDASTNFTTAYGNRLNGAMARSIFKTAKADLFALLKQQGAYVSDVAAEAKTNEEAVTIITSAGFFATKGKPSKRVTPTQPVAPTVSYKNSELIISTSSVAGATSYAWVVFLGDAFPITITGNQLEIAPAAKFIIVPAGTTRECVRNIAIGVDVNVQVLAQNTAGKSAFSALSFLHTGG